MEERRRQGLVGGECCNNEEYKLNCPDDLSSEINVPCNNICNARCVGVLAEKIFDCVYLDTLQFADKDEIFEIDGDFRGRYGLGDSICIQEVRLCYDFIGIKSDDELYERDSIGEGKVRVRYDMQDVIFTAKEASDFVNVGCCPKKCNCMDKDDKCENDTLFTELEGVVPRQICNAECSGRPNRKVRVFKQGVRFFVDDLVIKIKGRIGCRPFTATKRYNDSKCNRRGCPVEITKKDCCECGCQCSSNDKSVGLNFTPINLYGSIGVPRNSSTVNANIKFTTCLSADCVETSETYGESGEGRICATVGYSFLVNSSIRHTTSEEIAVFTNPQGVNCRNTSRNSDCIAGCNDIV